MSTDGSAAGEELRDRTEPTRFELYRNRELVGELVYRHLQPNRYVLLHTEVLPDHRGQGVGSALVRAALAQIRTRSGTVTAVCSFVVDFLDGNGEFADIIDSQHPGYPNRAAAEAARDRWLQRQ
ncbi:MAG: N-acetyltransferase, partial [Microlunatus sp.]|nr:N-acetyltransferase [Microlunatus sp.]